jgi:uncharacterized protein (UPF0179 family)
MKYLKTFEFFETETGQILDYGEGDTVVCSDEVSPKNKNLLNPLKKGSKYRVIKIYKNVEDKFLKNPYMRVDVVDLETNEISRGWESTRFQQDVEYIGNKFNI